MCTLTFLRTETGFVIGNSRDVAPERGNALPPQDYLLQNGDMAHYPMDIQSSGTWLAMGKEWSVCLLNGGFEKHIPAPSYPFSRGRVPIAFLNAGSPDNFLRTFSFEGFEPFTLIAFRHTDPAIYEITWTGKEEFVKQYPANKPHIWSSSTLYTPEAKTIRQEWFLSHLNHHFFGDPEEFIADFHHNGGKDYPVQADRILSFRKNGAVTVSITLISVRAEENKMQYYRILQPELLEYAG